MVCQCLIFVYHLERQNRMKRDKTFPNFRIVNRENKERKKNPIHMCLQLFLTELQTLCNINIINNGRNTRICYEYLFRNALLGQLENVYVPSLTISRLARSVFSNYYKA